MGFGIFLLVIGISSAIGGAYVNSSWRVELELIDSIIDTFDMGWREIEKFEGFLRDPGSALLYIGLGLSVLGLLIVLICKK